MDLLNWSQIKNFNLQHKLLRISIDIKDEEFTLEEGKKSEPETYFITNLRCYNQCMEKKNQAYRLIKSPIFRARSLSISFAQ